MLDISLRLADRPLVLLCGRNRELAQRLRGRVGGAPRLVVEYTEEVPYFLGLADYFIGKPGPGSLSEAIAKGLPAIVLANRWTMPQERYNVTWLEDRGLGLPIGRIADLPSAVAQVEQQLPAFRARVAAIRNQAVFEVPSVLDRIVARARDADPSPLPGPAAGRIRTGTVALTSRPASYPRA
jgi:1,2-diacylglycerol 3-beta-galactosyltransferase